MLGSDGLRRSYFPETGVSLQLVPLLRGQCLDQVLEELLTPGRQLLDTGEQSGQLGIGSGRGDPGHGIEAAAQGDGQPRYLHEKPGMNPSKFRSGRV